MRAINSPCLTSILMFSRVSLGGPSSSASPTDDDGFMRVTSSGAFSSSSFFSSSPIFLAKAQENDPFSIDKKGIEIARSGCSTDCGSRSPRDKNSARRLTDTLASTALVKTIGKAFVGNRRILNKEMAVNAFADVNSPPKATKVAKVTTDTRVGVEVHKKTVTHLTKDAFLSVNNSSPRISSIFPKKLRSQAYSLITLIPPKISFNNFKRLSLIVICFT
mmetsp:Transcript_16896/g.23397  ORF Transcript_16896/g.23397 Transcript_16896/m.23397 type:complete len:219 (-) Transcript_16896:1459-2115(-)